MCFLFIIFVAFLLYTHSCGQLNSSNGLSGPAHWALITFPVIQLQTARCGHLHCCGDTRCQASAFASCQQASFKMSWSQNAVSGFVKTAGEKEFSLESDQPFALFVLK